MTHHLPIAILTAAILSLPALAMAGPGHNASPACAAKHTEKLATYDANGDGMLDRDERAAMHRERTDKLFQEHDTNRDGVLSAAETEATCSRLTRHFDAIDADGNGLITRAELQAHHDTRAAHRRGKHGHRRHHDDAQ